MDNTMIMREDQSPQDLAFMDEAVLMAEEALHAKEIPVGCVLVHDGRIVARGRNRTNEGRNATLHAEFDALRHLLPDRSHSVTPQLTPLRGVALYVTVEPCLMCASAMRQVGIEKVYYGCANDRFGGTGGVQSIHSDPRLLYAPPYPAVGGYRREEAIMLLRRFYISENTSAPNPKRKNNRVLKTDIPEVAPSRSPSLASRSSTPGLAPPPPAAPAALAPAIPTV
ncbi:cytidine deaminase-like protein [Rhodotorula diobovata]|uniref:Cytidine deaminase-like protein n=1 Tax=Rhodotorula diobovata TaxID=5288 RepID=A0A5C5FZM1_9BASI|nr:cytidine deaminase-like protein [Rhodotorula diobovata]